MTTDILYIRFRELLAGNPEMRERLERNYFLLVTSPDAQFLAIPEAAERVRVSEPTIRRMLTQKRLRRFKIGSRTLIKASDLMDLIREV